VSPSARLDGQRFSPGSHTWERCPHRQVTRPACLVADGAGAQSFRPKKKPRTTPGITGCPLSLSWASITRSGSCLCRSTVNTRISLPSAPHHPHDRRGRPSPPPRRSLKKHQCNPPSRAAALTSKISHEQRVRHQHENSHGSRTKGQTS
jgi:hypothetical protein